MNQQGAALLMVLVSVALLGLMAGIAGSSWQTIVQRAKEADLLWKGNQICRAIDSYYHATGGKSATPGVLPSKLDHLLLDPRFLEVKRHLRQLYPDPMTGNEWEIIKDSVGRIAGVKSGSTKTPFKQDGFTEQNKHFVGKQSYQEWLFVYNFDKQTGLVMQPPKD
ncbi:MAG: type II secretion system protein [Thermodesulfobacteriota bacterium]|nr:type II secretion system protein [Thermodesulfobacteriota bacterium]